MPITFYYPWKKNPSWESDHIVLFPLHRWGNGRWDQVTYSGSISSWGSYKSPVKAFLQHTLCPYIGSHSFWRHMIGFPGWWGGKWRFRRRIEQRDHQINTLRKEKQNQGSKQKLKTGGLRTDACLWQHYLICAVFGSTIWHVFGCNASGLPPMV